MSLTALASTPDGRGAHSPVPFWLEQSALLLSFTQLVRPILFVVTGVAPAPHSTWRLNAWEPPSVHPITYLVLSV
jgi:hypothetical protein